MKYTIETHGCGYTETLEFRGKIYKKEHEGDASHTSTEDKNFCEWKRMVSMMKAFWMRYGIRLIMLSLVSICWGLLTWSGNDRRADDGKSD